MRIMLLASSFVLLAVGIGGAQRDRAVAADQSVQTTQLRAMAREPDTIDDKLFVLWEYAGALRERELAKAVLNKAVDPEVKALAVLVRDGHQAGMDRMVPVARELRIALPEGPTEVELAAIDAAAALPPVDLERFFLRRQRAMHAWDITVFEDFATVAKNPTLRRYVADTRAPLREHAVTVVQLSNKRGIPGGLTTIPTAGRN
jgi:hypothetical protein